ncbi:MAG: PqqD family protein [Bacteroidota bacterium]
MSTPLYRVNAPTVASKIIDGEAVLIHFTSGHYYSTDQTGAAIVDLLDGRSVADVTDALDAAYTGEGIDQAVSTFIDQLVTEGLVVEADAPSASPMPDLGTQGDFVAPELHRYADLQDLLVLDPIHDTDESGWPVAQPDTDA